MSSPRPRRGVLVALLLASVAWLVVPAASPAVASRDYEQVVDLTFPFDEDVRVSYTDDYDHCRSGCRRRHQSTDLMTAYGEHVHAVVGGRVSWMSGNGNRPPSYGWMLYVEGDDGRRYAYIHLGRQDRGPGSAFARGIREGARVERGQHLGFAGCSGSASCGAGNHLHLEIKDDRVRDPYGYHDHERINPFPSLRAAERQRDHPDNEGPFADVPGTALNAGQINKVVRAGITNGCGPDRFCPNRRVSRAEAATFVDRLLEHVHGDGFRLQAAGTSPQFVDVDPDSVHAPAIRELTRARVVRGCTERRFCGARSATRRELAVVLARALDLPSSNRRFSDVPGDAPWSDEVAAVAAAGITRGCGNNRFCPNQRVPRSQFAVFVARAMRVAG